MNNKVTGIFHRPTGMEHPYEQEPTERFPRRPAAGEPVTLGVELSPADADGRVWATWTVGQDPHVQSQAGERVADPAGKGRNLWRVALPAFAAGEVVTYQLHAGDESDAVSTESFRFTTAGWETAGTGREVGLMPEELSLVCAGPGESRSRVAFAFPAPGLVQMRLEAGRDNRSPNGRGGAPAAYRVIEQTAEVVHVAGEGVQVRVGLNPCRIEILDAHGKPVLQEASPLAWLTAGEEPPLAVRQEFASPPDERFYGFGERFNALNQRGNRLDLHVFEQYKNQGRRTYIPVSVWLSSQGYGAFVDTSRDMDFDLAAEQPDRWSYAAELGPEGSLTVTWVVSSSPAEILQALTRLTGKPKLPPTWAFGPWMSGNEWNTQQRVLAEVQQTLKHRIPASVLVIEAWSDETTFYIWNDARYEPKPGYAAFSYADFTFPSDGHWPDPQQMVDELHRQGIRLVLWQIPVLKKVDEPHAQQAADRQHMVKQGYCAHEPDGSPYHVRSFWFHDGLLWDPSHPEGAAWWLEKRRYLLDEMGIDGFKTDGGEHLWGREVVFANGKRGDEMVNLYPNLYVGAYHRFTDERRGGDALTFSRAGFTGAQAFPCHWAGDENSTWEAFRASLLAGLNAGLSGIPFWGWDIGGFSGPLPSAELYLRASAMAAFCPVMQYHSEFNEHRTPCRDRTPWNMAEQTGHPEVISIYRRFAELRMRLLPYIEAEARWCAESGEPLMRPLFLDWPKDPQAWQIDDQYLFGRALLVAPVLEAEADRRRVYLPPGEWQDLWDGTRLAGSQWVERPAPLDLLPVYRRLDRPWKEVEIPDLEPEGSRS